jgi:hypothetical protein
MQLQQPSVVFVRGCARSGTTLLSDVLNESPEIGILVEQPLGDVANRLSGLFWFDDHRREQRETIAAMASRKSERGGEYFAPIDNLQRMRFPLRYPTRERLGVIVAAVIEASLGKPHLALIGSKTPGHWNEHELAVVRELFAHLSYVFVVRNPWDTINSIVNRRNAARRGRDLWPDKPIEEAIARYQEGTCLLLSCARRYPERTYVVRYEDLLADPQSTLAGLGAFLGVELQDRSNLIVGGSRAAASVLTAAEDALVQAEFGAALRRWSEKRVTGPAGTLDAVLDDCVRTVEIGKQYRCDAPVGDRGMLGSGWSGAEPRGIWSDAPQADVFFAVPEDGTYALELELAACVRNRREGLRFTVTFGDQRSEHVLHHERNVRLRLGPVRLSGGRAHRVAFEFPSLPAASRDRSDPRRKGVRLRRIRVAQ